MKPQRMHSFVTPTFDTIANWLVNHGRVLSNISYGNANSDPSKNIINWLASGTTPGVANTDFTITHGLGYIPTTIIGQDTNNGGLLYRGSVAWTKTAVTLRCTTATAAYNVRLA
jgi:hypothetical protein